MNYYKYLCKNYISGGQCTYHGKAYKVGESFPSIDKCNTCACDADGSVPCTERFCLLNENQAGWWR